MDVAEDVVLRAGTGHGEKELFATPVTVQIGVCRAVGNEEINLRRDCDWHLQIRSCRDAVELDAVELNSIVLQKHDAVRNQAAGIIGLAVENNLVIAGDEYPEFGRNSCVPCEEVPQVGRVEAFASVSSTDENVGLGWY